jgi:hypothetical protein
MYDLIYNAAVEAEDENDLKNRLETIGAYTFGARKTVKGFVFTPIGELAFQGKDKAANLLYKLGGSIDELVRGYILAGNDAKFQEYGLLYEAEITLGGIARSFAELGKHERVKECIDSYCSDEKNTEENKKEFLNMIAYGYSASGFHEEATFYYNTYKLDINLMALGCAIGGHHQRVEKYREECEASPEFIVKGYVLGGYHERVEHYRITHNVSPKRIAKEYSEIGNRDKACEYDLKLFLKDYLDKRAQVLDNKGEIKQYFYGAFFVFQKSYQQKKEAVEALRSALDNHKGVDLSAHLSTLRNGRLGEGLRAFIKMGKADELVDGKKVRTVRDFVATLELNTKAECTV